MKINKILVGLVVAGVCGATLTAMASSNNGNINKEVVGKSAEVKLVEVKPVEVKPEEVKQTNTTTAGSNNNTGNVDISKIESYIVNKYGANWGKDLLAKNGENWDEILENELESHFGYQYDELIDSIIDKKENELGIKKAYTYNNYTTQQKSKKDEIIKNLQSKYGTNWAKDLLAKNGANWDDILENELKLQYGQQFEDIIEDIIDAKEVEAGLDYNDYDDVNDNDDRYDYDSEDDHDDINDYDDNDIDDYND